MKKTYTMAEHNANMTIFYYKRTGVIYSWGTGIQDFSRFDLHEEEYKLILDYIVVPKDNFILDNMKMFCVDTEEKALVYNDSFLQKYKMYR